MPAAERCKGTVNHDRAGFIENKRCRQEQRRRRSVVNPNWGVVYQTECDFVFD
jgi:hypothetical protein